MSKQNFFKIYTILLLLIVFITVGYAAFEQNFKIDNTVVEIRPKKDIRITGVNIDSVTNNGISNYEEYNHNSIFLGFKLPNENSTVKYKIEVTNIESTLMGIYKIDGLPDRLTYELEEYELKTTICNNENKCNLGITKEFYITIKYKEKEIAVNADFDLELELDFREIYNIEYIDIENNNYPEYIIDGDDLEIEFFNNVPINLIIYCNDILLSREKYSYTNNKLIINKVDGNLKIKLYEDINPPLVTLSTSFLDNKVTATIVSIEDESDIKNTYGWSMSQNSVCDDTLNFTDSENLTYEYELSSSGNYFVCTKVEDLYGNTTFTKILASGSYNNYFETMEHAYIVPFSGYYKLEVWGAQGGNANSIEGGYGGYSTGVTYLEEGEVIYINVGGKGTNGVKQSNTTTDGGYNGGGYGYVSSAAYYVAGGGGATHIAKESGILSSLSAYAENHNSPILIVAGGGGGVSYNNSTAKTNTIGHAGGYIGVESKGTTSEGIVGYASGGRQVNVGVNGEAFGSFGQGGNIKSASNSGGGGGYYGGNTHNYAGGGGSGYIANNNLTSKVMYCYNCSSTDAYSTKTVTTTNVSENPISNYAKKGNGYAKITFVNTIIDEKKIAENDYEEYLLERKEQVFITPKNGYYKIEAWGAQGGNANTIIGGKGGYTSGIIYLEKDEKLYIYVGGKGKDAVETSNKTIPGGYNGGGNGRIDSASYYVASSGGATDIRYFALPPIESDLVWNSSLGLNSRIMVAGGGGGTSYLSSQSKTYTVGYAGGLKGRTSKGIPTSGDPYYASGGTQTGAGGDSNVNGFGGFGYGGNGTTASIPGGGSGYYGGNANLYSGGGGSSFISGYAGVNAIASSTDRTHTNNTKHYSGKYFINTQMSANNASGDGKAKITYLGINKFQRVNPLFDNVRYIKNCTNGNSINTYNQWREIQAIKEGENVALNKTVSGIMNTEDYPLTNAVDGITDSGYASDFTETAQCLTIDLEENYNLDEIVLWHVYGDSRKYNNNILYVSSDNISWNILAEIDEEETEDGYRINVWE